VQPTATISSTLVGDFSRIIIVTIGQNSLSGFREDKVKALKVPQQTTKQRRVTIVHIKHFVLR